MAFVPVVSTSSKREVIRKVNEVQQYVVVRCMHALCSYEGFTVLWSTDTAVPLGLAAKRTSPREHAFISLYQTRAGNLADGEEGVPTNISRFRFESYMGCLPKRAASR